VGAELIQADRQMDECIDMIKIKVAFCEYASVSNRYTFTKLQHQSIDLVLNVLSKNINCSTISIKFS